jgi:TorA maturation chaperone TorD
VRSSCPPYELEYRTAEVFQQSQTLADIAGFYRAFGCDAAGSLTERADHIASEWEFLALLAWKESIAKRDDQVACCIDAQASFLQEHAAVWMPAFFSRIRQAEPGSFLAHLASLADLVLRDWCEALNVSIGSAWLELRPITEEDSTITCGTPGAVELGPTLAAAMEAGG